VEVIDDVKRDVRCLILGCGSIGSHIFRQLSMLSLKKIVLVDKDTVGATNIYRQDYYAEDTGKRKINVLASRPSNADEVSSVFQFVDDEKSLNELILKNHVNLVIQAADVPTTEGMAHLINKACDRCGIPYIVNPGYTGGAVSLPEFFYPNCEYGYTSSHQSLRGKRLLQFQKSKLSYRLCSELACLVTQQVDDYQHYRVPTRYGEKGYFDVRDFAWHTEHITDMLRYEPKETIFADI
jgi:hypothetical protein